MKKKYHTTEQVKIRKRIHVLISLLLIFVIIAFKYLIKDASVISKLFTFAGYTYGPLLGLYAFGLFTKMKVHDKWVPIIAITSPILTYIISIGGTIYSYLTIDFSTCETTKWDCAVAFASNHYYQFGFELLLINGVLTFLGLILICSKQN